jgi:hypothetical protein
MTLEPRASDAEKHSVWDLPRRFRTARFRQLGGVVLGAIAGALAALSLQSPVHPCDNADTRLRLALAAAVVCGVAVAWIRRNPKRRWRYAILSSVLAFGVVWLYSIGTTDFSCLN